MSTSCRLSGTVLPTTQQYNITQYQNTLILPSSSSSSPSSSSPISSPSPLSSSSSPSPSALVVLSPKLSSIPFINTNTTNSNTLPYYNYPTTPIASSVKETLKTINSNQYTPNLYRIRHVSYTSTSTHVCITTCNETILQSIYPCTHNTNKRCEHCTICLSFNNLLYCIPVIVTGELQFDNTIPQSFCFLVLNLNTSDTFSNSSHTHTQDLKFIYPNTLHIPRTLSFSDPILNISVTTSALIIVRLCI